MGTAIPIAPWGNGDTSNLGAFIPSQGTRQEGLSEPQFPDLQNGDADICVAGSLHIFAEMLFV